MVVAVNLLDGPSECGPLIGKWLQLHDLRDWSNSLNPVVVHDGHKIRHSVMGSEQSRLPG